MTTTPDRAAPRRMPTQQRSRERVERMLLAAREIIAADGTDGLRMAQVAERAGVPIGSLYQFFPDKAAIIRMLAMRCNEESRACIRAGLEPVADEPGLLAAFGALIDEYYSLFRADPVISDIWSGMQADKLLREMEVEESRLNGRLLADTIRRIRPGADPAAVEATAFLVMHLGEATMRLAIAVPPEEGDRLVATYRRMALEALAGSSPVTQPAPAPSGSHPAG
ncbi:TetR/AcrR family transcriptional regulator [Tistrella mobilis]|uniref:TetR/AcrR family transcriptional regulator n=1 Tax=Tistrella mobilis TaxID=171437 RepID=UPI0032012D65